jgi:penicillin-binding protein 1A
VEETEKKKPIRRRRPSSRLLLLFVAIAIGVPSGFIFAHVIRIPLVSQLDHYRPNIITRLYDRNGRVFAEYAIQRRIILPKKELSPHLVNAIIATEDARFHEHGGVDPRSIVRAALKDLAARKKVEGASTLTQQLAKQVFLTPEKSFRRKINEAFLAFEIEKNFTKDQIFEMYANQVYLGHGAYGAEAAARLYFGKHAKDLTIPEAALIAGMIRRPMFYSPINNPEQSIARRNHVLRRLLERKFISREEFTQAMAAPLVLGTFKEETPALGAYFAEDVRQYLEKNYGTEDLYQNGLEIWTTLDTDIQLAAESALRDGLHALDRRRGFRRPTRNLIKEGIEPDAYRDVAWKDEPVAGQLYPAVVTGVSRREVELRVGERSFTMEPSGYSWTRRNTMEGVLQRGDLVTVRYSVDPKSSKDVWSLDQVPQVQGAAVVLDTKTGEIRALVGGYDFGESKFNRAVQSLRQTGSIFKAFVYGAALERGFTPADTLFDAPVAIRVGNQIYSPRNYGGKYAGIVTIQRAMELSINVPAVKTYMMVGGEHVVDFTRRMGITSPLPQYPSLALGAAGVSPLQMAAAFNVFANQGVYIKPRYITRITDSTKKVLEEQLPDLSEATSAQVAYQMAHVMKGTVDRGTAYAARKLKGELAGKTGTTNGFTDAWFVGFTPEYTIAVWVGYDDPARSLGSGSTGGAIALPIWTSIMEQLDAKEMRDPAEKLPVPPGVVMVPMDLHSGRRGNGPCGRVVMGAFVAGTEPDKDCSGASAAVSQLPYHQQQAFYIPKESEPAQIVDDATATTGEGGESALPVEGAVVPPARRVETP